MSSPFPRARLLTILCYGAMMSLAIGINLLPVFLTTLSSVFGGEAGALTNEQLGRLGACVFSGLVVGILITGPLADRFGAKVFALLGDGLVAGGLLGMALAPNYAVLAAMLFVLGFGSGLLDMVLSPVVAALNPTRRAAAMNWLHSFYCVGAAVTILGGSLTLRMGLGWRGSCLALLPLPVLLFVALSLQRFPGMTTKGARTPFFQLCRDHWFMLALAAIFLGGAAEMGMAQWLPAYAERSLGFSAWTGGMALLLFSVAMALGRMVIGAAEARWPAFAIMIVSCLSSVVLFGLGSFLPWSMPALICCILVGFTGSCLWPTMLAVTADRYPDGGASMFGALAALGNAGGIFMPWLVGWVADWSNLHWGLVTSAIAPILMWLVLRRMRNSRPAKSR
ncbi:MFS transporter [Opitutaceae bacterium TAV4]|nr:MFS transporter [Opitutaceae bacterium TAV4]RRJ98613.1 MFS transporter [Opitutaceae bacterium TAV3]